MLGMLVVGVAFVGYELYAANRQPQTVQTPQWPDDAAYQDGECYGTYANGVTVAWPSVNETCP